MRVLASLLIVSAVIGTAFAVQVRERDVTSDTLERPFAAGGTIRMDLSAGEYRIEAGQDDRIRINWSAKDGGRLRWADVRADIKGTEALIHADGPSRSFHVRIEVPRRSDVEVRLTAGELALRGIEGNKDVELHAGEMNLDVGRVEDYGRVDASVWAGEIHATPFSTTKDGLFRSFKWQGTGTYRLHAHLKAGELRMTASPTIQK